MGDPVVAFQQAAENYRAAIEAAKDSEPGASFARRLRNAVASVYLAAALLDSGDLFDEDDAPDIDTTRSSELESAVRSRFGPADTFWEVWDPTELDESDPSCGTLAGELVEIYEDLGVALALLAMPERRGALWDITEGFADHWGEHAVNVLRPLHQLARYGIAGFDYPLPQPHDTSGASRRRLISRLFGRR